MLAWMSYVIVVSLLLGLAAIALECAARIRQKPTRWLWRASMIASLLLPLGMSSVWVPITQLAPGVDEAIPESIVALRQMTAGLSPSGWLAAAGPFATSPDLDRLLQVGWSAASTILLFAILAGSVQLSLRWIRAPLLTTTPISLALFSSAPGMLRCSVSYKKSAAGAILAASSN